jgi:hypothetical protein
VTDAIKGKQAPLVVATVDHLIPIYRDANTYANLAEKGLTGNPKAVADEVLRDRALEVLDPRFGEERAAAAGRFEQLAGTGRTSRELDQVVVAAHQSRVDALFVPAGRQRWGRYDADSTAVEIHASEEPGDQDLLDLAAVQSLSRGARVFVVDPEEIPNGNEVAAVFRF